MNIPLLTIGESKVYSSLSELGESSIGDIIKTSGVSHSKIYDILKRLSVKGLVSSINKNGKQFFTAANPKRLNELIREEKERLYLIQEEMNEKVKILNARRDISKSTSILSSFEGIKGMKTVLDSVLTDLVKNDEVLILGSPKIIGEFSSGYLKDWQKKRIKTGSVCKIIMDLNSPSWDEPWWKESKKKKLTFTKRSKTISPAYLVITKNSVATIYFSSIILSFKIEHKEIALRYMDFFNESWKNAST